MVSKKEWESISSELKKILNKKLVSAEKGYFDEYIKKIVDKKNIFLESCNKFGTPQYILDETELINRAKFFMNTFKKSIPNSEFLYPFKCNDLPYLINILKNIGFGADVAGLFELELALRLGFKKIIFSSPGKDVKELRLAIKNSDKVIVSIDNIDEVKTFLKLVEESSPKNEIKISFRLNTSEDSEDVWSKFGLTFKELRMSINKIKNNTNISWTGLHFHTSWNKTPNSYVQNIKSIGKNLKNNFTQKEISNLSFLDIGGGFCPEGEGTLFSETSKGMLIELLDNEGIDHPLNFDTTNFYVEDPALLEEFSKKISETINNCIIKPLNKKNIKIFYEPGRYITKHSSCILTTVLAVKKRAIILDAGTLTMLGGYGLANYEYTPIINLSKPSLKTRKTIVYGPLCEPSDIWGYRYHGEKAEPGDIMAILNQGAYTFSFSQRFIKPGAPYVVITKDNKLVCARKKESFEDRYKGCELNF